MGFVLFSQDCSERAPPLSQGTLSVGECGGGVPQTHEIPALSPAADAASSTAVMGGGRVTLERSAGVAEVCPPSNGSSPTPVASPLSPPITGISHSVRLLLRERCFSLSFFFF